jgi:hypothetical protein
LGASKAPAGRMTVRDDLEKFPESVDLFEDEGEGKEAMIQELEEDKPKEKVTMKKISNEEFDFPQVTAEGEEDNPFHYVQKKGLERRRSSFAGTGFEKLASNDQEESDLEDFFTTDKLFLILTRAGKPVFSS